MLENNKNEKQNILYCWNISKNPIENS